jgi:hypothetical protein
MKPNLLKKSGLQDLKIHMKPSILARPALKIKEQVKKVLNTFKPL